MARPSFLPRPRRIGRRLVAIIILCASVTLAWRTFFEHDTAGAQAIPGTVITLAPALHNCVQPTRVAMDFRVPTPASITGRVGLFVAKLAPGNDFKPVASVALNADQVFPLASAFKPSVLLAYLKQVDARKSSLEETFDVTAANQSLGDYPFDNSSARQLAARMIQYSDNTATDILFRRVGLGSLQPIADKLGLCRTRLMLPTKDWWAAESGLTKTFPKATLVAKARAFAKASPLERLQTARRLDRDAQSLNSETMRKALDTYFDGTRFDAGTMASIDLNLQNASTPEEWARLLVFAFSEGALSKASRAAYREVMALGYGRGRVHHQFVYFGGKEGNTSHILTLSGYMEQADGSRLVYTFFNDRNVEIDTFALAPSGFQIINAALDAVDRHP